MREEKRRKERRERREHRTVSVWFMWVPVLVLFSYSTCVPPILPTPALVFHEIVTFRSLFEKRRNIAWPIR